MFSGPSPHRSNLFKRRPAVDDPAGDESSSLRCPHADKKVHTPLLTSSSLAVSECPGWLTSPAANWFPKPPCYSRGHCCTTCFSLEYHQDHPVLPSIFDQVVLVTQANDHLVIPWDLGKSPSQKNSCVSCLGTHHRHLLEDRTETESNQDSRYHGPTKAQRQEKETSAQGRQRVTPLCKARNPIFAVAHQN